MKAGYLLLLMLLSIILDLVGMLPKVGLKLGCFLE
jgi:hypothetical protein